MKCKNMKKIIWKQLPIILNIELEHYQYRQYTVVLNTTLKKNKTNISLKHWGTFLVGGDCHTKHPTLSLLLTTPKGRKFLAAVDTNSLHCLIKTTNI